MPTEQQKKKTGQTLSQTAQDPGNPSNMMRILGTAGEGFTEFLKNAYEQMVPQSVEELALEGSPLGKGVGMLAGMIPTKFVKPRIDRLKSIAFGPGSDLSEEAKEAAEYYIKKYPNVMAHVDHIDAKPFSQHQATFFQPVGMGKMQYDIATSPAMIQHSVDTNSPIFKWHKLPKGTRIGVRDDLGQQGAWQALRHETNHAAQFSRDPSTLLHDNIAFPYAMRPIELGSQIAEQKAVVDMLGNMYGASGKKALMADLPKNTLQEVANRINQLKIDYDPDNFNYMLKTINERIAPTGNRFVTDWTPTGQPWARMEKIVLGR
jgi:hypothetical protein